LAIAGLVLGYLTLVLGVILPAMGFAGAQAAINRARKTRARKVCVTIDQAVMSFYDEYGFLPTNPDGDTTLQTDNDEGNLLTTLLGYEPRGGDMENQKKIRFFEAGEAKGGKGKPKDGIRYGSSNSAEGLFDPWGGPYHVILDGDYDEQVDDPFGGPPLRGRRVVTYSLGKNGRDDGGAGDDVKSW